MPTILGQQRSDSPIRGKFSALSDARLSKCV
jgi:hypothetical protein